AKEIARYPPGWHIIGLRDDQFFAQYATIFAKHTGPVAWIHLTLGTLTPDITPHDFIGNDVTDWLNPNRLHITCGQNPFDMMQLLQYGHYNIQTNTYNNPIRSDLAERGFPDTALYLQTDATDILRAFDQTPKMLDRWAQKFIPN